MNIEQIPSPCFVLDEKLLRSNLELIRYVQEQSGAEIILAFKGFAMWSAFPIVREYIKGATASSLYEARLCFEEMKTLAHVYAPAYFHDEFEELMNYSSHIVFNSLSQLRRFGNLINTAKHHISCGLRVNPEKSDVETELYNPSSPKSRLGILSENLPDVLPDMVEGLHFHVLCESTSQALEEVIESFEKLFGKYIPKLKWVNFGGGHLMTRKGYDIEHLIRIIKSFKQKHNVNVILEPGSAFAWDTGVLVSKVQDIVQSRGVQTAILDVSFTAHMPDTLEMPYKPRVRGAKEPDNNSNPKYKYRLGGVSCLAGDFMEEYDFGKELKVGDTIVLEDMIHYTMVKTNMFNGVKHPSIAIWKANETLQMVREFNYNDFKSRLS
ncbi:MAG: carboxynorspermidine decarboxylase [Salinivirgaceae bacterium]|jgi:carboxynorspermidine decarboxylase|nr:carboxynorspermidine decarboxylase [Bacteroidales bacterium]